jgi:hypothetical protein
MVLLRDLHHAIDNTGAILDKARKGRKFRLEKCLLNVGLELVASGTVASPYHPKVAPSRVRDRVSEVHRVDKLRE